MKPPASPRWPLLGETRAGLFALVLVTAAAVLTVVLGSVGAAGGAVGPLAGILAALAVVGAVLLLRLNQARQTELGTLVDALQRLAATSPDALVEIDRSLALLPPLHEPALAAVAAALRGRLEKVREARVELILASERSEAARRVRSHELAAMSHDLRGPLSSILGFTELLRGGYEGALAPEVAVSLVGTHQVGARLLRLVGEVLDAAKLESQTLELFLAPCAVATLLHHAVAEVRRVRLGDRPPIHLDVAPGLPLVTVDAQRLAQALAHLVAHALDAVEPPLPLCRDGASEAEARLGEIVLRARLSDGEPPQQLLCEVVHRRIPTEIPEPPAGFSLALPLARRLVELHGGRVELAGPDSAPHFRALIPLAQPFAPRSRP